MNDTVTDSPDEGVLTRLISHFISEAKTSNKIIKVLAKNTTNICVVCQKSVPRRSLGSQALVLPCNDIICSFN